MASASSRIIVFITLAWLTVIFIFLFHQHFMHNYSKQTKYIRHRRFGHKENDTQYASATKLVYHTSDLTSKRDYSSTVILTKANPTSYIQPSTDVMSTSNGQPSMNNVQLSTTSTTRSSLQSSTEGLFTADVQKPGCKIPHFNPFSKTVMEFIETLPPHDCSREPPLVYVERDTLVVNTTLLDKRREKLLHCGYQVITRVDDEKVFYADTMEFNYTVQPGAEFVRVECFTKSPTEEKRYVTLLSIVTEKPEVEAALTNLTNSEGDPDDFNDLPMNLVMVGVDSVSRFNMYRHLNRTRSFLVEQMQAIELVNYNKVGVNTLPNILPMMSGRSQSSFKEDVLEKEYMDSLGISFLWEELKQKGYRTQFSEDWPDVAIFNFARKGFKEQPAHYYYRTLEKAMHEHEDLFTDDEHCFMTQPADELILNYTLEFQRVFRHKPHFSFTFLTRSTHDDVNGASQVDDYHAEFLATMVEEGLHNNTLYIFFSDHGMRWGYIRDTEQGAFEDNRPFMFLAFPPWLHEKRPDIVERVQRNAARLVTPFDIHATLQDISNLHRKDFRAASPLNETKISTVGISLFDEIPADRRCAEAGIPLLLCVCLEKRLLNTSLEHAQQASATVVNALNTAMTNANVTDVCHTLELAFLVSVTAAGQSWQFLEDECATSKSDITNASVTLVTLITRPGYGQFEAVVARCDSDSEMFVFGSVDRTNEYGNSSFCVDENKLKPICFCKGMEESWGAEEEEEEKQTKENEEESEGTEEQTDREKEQRGKETDGKEEQRYEQTEGDKEKTKGTEEQTGTKEEQTEERTDKEGKQRDEQKDGKEKKTEEKEQQTENKQEKADVEADPTRSERPES